MAQDVGRRNISHVECAHLSRFEWDCIGLGLFRASVKQFTHLSRFSLLKFEGDTS
jgi:hypothetical protein